MINLPRTALYCVSAVAITFAASSTAFAQGMTTDKMAAVPTAGQTATKTIAENEKLIVTEAVGRPGTGTPMSSRAGIVYHYVTGGTFERTFADGSKDTVTRKTGETLLITEKRPYSTKNIGKTTVHVISVRLK